MNREILKLAIPNIISNLSVPLLSLVDVALMGHLDSAEYILTIGFGVMIFNFVYWGFGFLRMGATGFTGLLGRLLLARVADQVDTRTYSAAILVVQAVVLGAMALFPSVAVLIAMSLVYGFCLGQITTLSPIVVRREFGAAAFGAIYGIAGTVIQFCSAFGPAIFGVLVDLFGGYGPVLAVAAGFELSAALVLLVGRARR